MKFLKISIYTLAAAAVLSGCSSDDTETSDADPGNGTGVVMDAPTSGQGGTTVEMEMTPAEMTPDEMTPDEMVPADMTPEEMTPDEMVPDEMVPVDMTPDEMIPEMEMVDSSAWRLSTHSCIGNRTDTLWCDNDQMCSVGCGTTTEGDMGYFNTIDGGTTWTAPSTTPVGFFETARVNSIWRDADDTLFISGQMPNSTATVSVNASGTVAEVFTRGTVVDNSFTVGNFRRASSGFAIAESLTGTGLVHREMDGGDPTDSWTGGTGFWADGDADDDPFGVQLLDMEVFNGEFWGVGSTISQPPIVLSPKWPAGDFDFGITPLATGLGAFDGELHGIDINADGVAVGGVNQVRNVGVIYTLGSAGDPTDATAWTSFDVSTIFPAATTWVTDVCRAANNTVYATGRESSEGWGFVLVSADGGATFSDITPYDSEGNSLFLDVSRCHAFDEGVLIAGAGGLFARNF